MGALRGWHIIVLIAVLVLLFGYNRLPNMARSLGRSLRIMKAETKSLLDDDDLAEKAEAPHSRKPAKPDAVTGEIADNQASPLDAPETQSVPGNQGAPKQAAPKNDATA